jgi:hypothetical protein
MRKYRTAALISVLAGLIMPASQAQSLGDAAREQRQKKLPKSATTPPKIISNDDIVSPGASVPSSSTAGASTSAASTAAASQASSSAAAALPKKPLSSDDPSYDEWAKAGKEWKARILEQKAKIQSMQSYIDKLKSSVHFAAKNPDYDASVINRHELQKVDEANRLEKQLNDQTSTLQNMQDALRTAGYDASTYNPHEETDTPTAPVGIPQN